MSKFKMIQAKYGVCSGVACGPYGYALAEIEVEDETGKRFFLSLADPDDIPCFACAPISTFEAAMSMETDSEYERQAEDWAFTPYEAYDEIFDGDYPAEGDVEWMPVLRALAYLTLTYDESEQAAFAEAIAGKYADEIEIPKSVRELEYIEEMMEDGEWDGEDEENEEENQSAPDLGHQWFP